MGEDLKDFILAMIFTAVFLGVAVTAGYFEHKKKENAGYYEMSFKDKCLYDKKDYVCPVAIKSVGTSDDGRLVIYKLNTGEDYLSNNLLKVNYCYCVNKVR